VTEAVAGQLISLGDGAYLEVISPEGRLLRGTPSDVNNASVVMRLVYGEVSFFLSGDMFSEAEGALLARQGPIDSDVLKVAHHGSRTSSRADFIQAVSPAAAVISAGADNGFGHPHAEVIEGLRRHVPEQLLFTTQDSGTIEFVTDGKSLRVRTKR
jgi:competence protein ComEC